MKLRMVTGPMGGVGGEGVFFKLIVLEVVAQECFGLDVAGAGGPARADGDEFAGVFVGFGAVEVLLGRQTRGRRGQIESPRSVARSRSPVMLESKQILSVAPMRGPKLLRSG